MNEEEYGILGIAEERRSPVMLTRNGKGSASPRCGERWNKSYWHQPHQRAQLYYMVYERRSFSIYYSSFVIRY